MMTTTDNANIEAQDEPRSRPFLGQLLFYAGVSLIAGALGAAAIFVVEDAWNGIAIGIVAVLIAFGAVLTYISIKIGDFDPPGLSNSAGRAQLLMLVYVLLGAATGIYVNATKMDGILDGTFTLTSTEAVVGLVILFAIILPSAIYHWMQSDDFQRAAIKDAAMWTFNVYIYGYIAWAMGAAGGLFPPIDHFAIFIVLTFFYLGVYAYKRSG